MQAFEWQDKDNHTPFWVHMIAGSCAGIAEHISMLPLDNIKTHYQAGSHFRITQIIRSIYDHGGFKNFYSGSSILAMGCIPAHAMYFSIYQKSKKFLNCQHQDKTHRFAIVGALASLFHDSIMTPTQVIKQRLQLYRTEIKWIQTHELMSLMYRQEGMISFYRSFGVNYLMNVPFSSMIILMNEKLKRMFKVKENDHHLSYYVCGGIAGGLASVPNTPFDVIKTRLNTQVSLNYQVENSQKNQQTNYVNIKAQGNQQILEKTKSYVKYNNVIDTTLKIYQQEGIKGFFAGLKMRIFIQSFSSAIAWGTYQVVKSTLAKQSNQRH